MKLEWFLGWRYLKGSHNSTFISIITVIAAAGIALGVAALIIVLGVMNGFDRELEDKIIGNLPILTIESEGGINNYEELMSKLREMESVRGAHPFIKRAALLHFKDRFAGALIKGTDESRLFRGEEMNGIALGGALAEKLGVITGESLSIVSASTKAAQKGKLKPRVTKCKVVKIFSSEIYEYDNSLARMNISTAQILFEMGNTVSGIELKLSDIYQADHTAKKIRQKLGTGFYITSWTDRHRNLFSALRLEKTVMFIILTLIILVAAFNVASILIMITIKKTKDIGILKAVGASSWDISKIFIIEGLLIGICGIALGGAFGLGVCRLLENYPLPWLPKQIYPFENLPVRIELLDLACIGAVTLILSLLASVYPARQASKLKPTEALRYE